MVRKRLGRAGAGLLAVMMLASLSAIAQAKDNACYSKAEMEAEQAMRFQTEVMVLSDTCSNPAYSSFAKRNREALVTYQQRMVEHFRRGGDRHAQTSFDHYQTELANETSLRVGEKPSAQACREAAGTFATAAKLDNEGLHRYAAELATKHAKQYRGCKG